MSGIEGHKVYGGSLSAPTFKQTQEYLYVRLQRFSTYSVVNYFQWFLVIEVSYSWTMILLKLSIGYFFLRLLVTPAQRRTVYTVMYFAGGVNFILSIYDISQCGNPRDPISKIALKSGCPSQTIQESLTAWTQAILNALTDLFFACMPFWLLNNSMLPRDHKLYVLGILGLATM